MNLLETKGPYHLKGRFGLWKSLVLAHVWSSVYVSGALVFKVVGSDHEEGRAAMLKRIWSSARLSRDFEVLSFSFWLAVSSPERGSHGLTASELMF